MWSTVKAQGQMARIALFVVAAVLAGNCNPRGGDRAVSAPSEPSERAAATAAEKLPGAPAFDAPTIQAFRRAWSKRKTGYKPRTRHVREDGSPLYTNRLFLESSPYLLQHAHNPVSWYPWGNEAFETARRLGRPVLLSVGYSTCHWCHVMEEESFEDLEIARYMNENYIAIKVDREQRPDVDAVYMEAVHLMTGRGGWPMTVWLTPERKPFFGGTYFPPREGTRGARTGFLSVLKRMKEIHDDDGDRVERAGADVSKALQGSLLPDLGAEDLPGPGVLYKAFDHYAEVFDPIHGGHRGAPKFPSSMPVPFLLRYHRRTGNEKALGMATKTLEAMAAGGIHDQVGGGFHRYSTDDQWLVPHFEKMLYDNALLAAAYLEAYQVTKRGAFARVARKILDYVTKEMTDPAGAFYSASDADSVAPGGHREEGYYFTWTPEEITEVVGVEPARVINAYYGVTQQGNFEGRSILHISRPMPVSARILGLAQEELQGILAEANRLLYEARLKRPRPLRDEKMIASWNGLMIGAFARAALILDRPEYAGQARQAADFILTKMRQQGRLARAYKDGTTSAPAFLDDYAFVIGGLLDLYEATGERRWLVEAISLDRVLTVHYFDDQGGGYFRTPDDGERLLVREKPYRDHPLPSGNAVQMLNLLRLHGFTTDDRFRERAAKTFRAFARLLEGTPQAGSEMLLAADYLLAGPKEIAIITPEKRSDAKEFLEVLGSTFLSSRVLVVVSEGPELERQGELVPWLKGKTAREGRATAYVCREGLCKFPTGDPEVLLKQILDTDELSGG